MHVAVLSLTAGFFRRSQNVTKIILSNSDASHVGWLSGREATAGQNTRLAEGLSHQHRVVDCANMAMHAMAAHDKQKLVRVRMTAEKTMTRSSRGFRRPMTVESCVDHTDREIGTVFAG